MRFFSLIFALIFLVSSAPGFAQTPPPPGPVFGGGPTGKLPGAAYRDLRPVLATDFGLAMSGYSPVGYAGRRSLQYLNLGVEFNNRLLHLETRSMLAIMGLDALLGLGIINLNLGQSRSFPPFVQALNDSALFGIYELLLIRAGFVFAANESRAWVYDFQVQLDWFGARPGAPGSLFAGSGVSVGHTWFAPIWEVTLEGFGGPEYGSGEFGYFAGADLQWRRAISKGLAPYLRFKSVVHYLTASQALLTSGIVEVGFSFGNWE